jgi:serine protease
VVALSLVSAAAPASAATPAAARGEVIVHYRPGTGSAERAHVEALAGIISKQPVPGGSEELAVADGASVSDTIAQLEKDRHVAYAVPNFIANAGAIQPNDRGYPLQWNFWGPFGIDLPRAWSIAARRGAPGGRGAIVAVLDTGVAYRTLGRFRRAPDLRSFVPGHDFVDGDSRPFDLNGHGTFVAGTIAEATNNRIGASGIAYNARIMPVRTLDRLGAGDTAAIARGVRYAVRHHADVINLSLEFPPAVRASDIPDLLAALRYARRHRVVVTTVAGNGGRLGLPYPARARSVIAVAATTEHGCQAAYSNAGPEVDVAAPGGGSDAVPAPNDAWSLVRCHPGVPGRSIFQQTFQSLLTRFGLPGGYYGTSMAAPHVAGVAALVIGTRRLGRHPRPAAVQRLIERTARDLGPPGFDVRYGHGLVDAAAALR